MKKLQEIKGPMTGQEVLENLPFSLCFHTIEIEDTKEKAQEKVSALLEFSKERLALHLALIALVWNHGLEGEDESQQAKLQELAEAAYKVANPPDMGKRMTFV